MNSSVDWFWLFLNPRGRLTRLPYFLAMTLIMLVSCLFIYRHLLGNLPVNVENPWSTPGLVELATFITLATMWPMIALSAKRAADIGITPFVGGLIAVLGILLVAVLSVIPGSDQPNRYGSDRNIPPRRS